MTDRKFWQEVRRGLLTIVAAIVKRWLEGDDDEERPIRKPPTPDQLNRIIEIVRDN